MNSDKCHIFISGNKFEYLWTKIGNNRILENRTLKHFGITIDNELKFDEHLSNVCLKVNRKLSALMRIKKYFDFKKISILFKGFFEAQFKYCPLTWMFYSKSANRGINHLHERALSLIYDDYELTFEELLEKDGSFTIHHSNIQMLCIELYEIYHNLSQTIFGDLFRRNTSSSNLPLKLDFVIPQVRTVLKGFKLNQVLWSNNLELSS